MLHNASMLACTYIIMYIILYVHSMGGIRPHKTIKLVNLAATQSKQYNGHTVLPGQEGNHIPTYQMAAAIVHQKAPSVYLICVECVCVCVCVCVCAQVCV